MQCGEGGNAFLATDLDDDRVCCVNNRFGRRTVVSFDDCWATRQYNNADNTAITRAHEPGSLNNKLQRVRDDAV